MRDSGFTLVEMAIAIVIAGILGVMAAAALARARATANESSAVAALKSINISQTSYNAACGRGGYAQSLVILGRPPHAAATGGYLDPELSSATVVLKNGYKLQVQPGAGAVAAAVDCNGNETVTAYYASAIPDAFGETGSRSFATSHFGALWQAHTATPPTEPFGPPAEMFK